MISPRGYIVAGTDTGIGKTIFAAGLIRALGASYWKPIQAGLDGPTDSDTVRQLSGLPSDRILPEAYRLKTPCSPHEAARRDGVSITSETLKPPDIAQPLVIEAAGGLLVPITDAQLQIDLFQRFARPLILCARTSLGTINHTLLSVEALRARNLPLAGIAFIGDDNAVTRATICRLACTDDLGRLPPIDPLTPETLASSFAAAFPALTKQSVQTDAAS